MTRSKSKLTVVTFAFGSAWNDLSPSWFSHLIRATHLKAKSTHFVKFIVYPDEALNKITKKIRYCYRMNNKSSTLLYISLKILCFLIGFKMANDILNYGRIDAGGGRVDVYSPPPFSFSKKNVSFDILVGDHVLSFLTISLGN